MIIEAIAKVSNNEDLDSEMASAVMDEIVTGAATQAQIGSFLTALHMKGETIEEITNFAKIMRKLCAEFNPGVPEEIEIVGTGGDRAGTFNIQPYHHLSQLPAEQRLQSTETVRHQANAVQPTVLKHSVQTLWLTRKSVRSV